MVTFITNSVSFKVKNLLQMCMQLICKQFKKTMLWGTMSDEDKESHRIYIVILKFR